MAVPNLPGWQAIILRKVGAPATPENIRYINAWAQAEGGSAQNNPFNTTEPGHNTTGDYNSVGVKRYGSAQDGIQATVDTLENGHYGAILQALKSGKSAMADAQAEATTPWGTGALIEKVLGGPVTGGQPTVGGSSVSAGGAPINAGGSLSRQQLAQLVFGQGVPNFGSNQITPPNLMALAEARANGGIAATGSGSGAGTPQGPTGPVSAAGNIPGGFYMGDTAGVNPAFLSKLTGAARAAGVTRVKVISGYRSPSHNASVGGAHDSNHMTGHAMDAQGYIPGRGWQPLGAILLPSAGKFGLRSGDTPGFFNGSTDPNHVDDAWNQSH